MTGSKALALADFRRPFPMWETSSMPPGRRRVRRWSSARNTAYLPVFRVAVRLIEAGRAAGGPLLCPEGRQRGR
jgi:hypothetical protein